MYNWGESGEFRTEVRMGGTRDELNESSGVMTRASTPGNSSTFVFDSYEDGVGNGALTTAKETSELRGLDSPLFRARPHVRLAFMMSESWSPKVWQQTKRE
jgi:hypothetical protein